MITQGFVCWSEKPEMMARLHLIPRNKVSIKTERVITTVEMMVITPWGAWAKIYYIDKLMLSHGVLAETV